MQCSGELWCLDDDPPTLFKLPAVNSEDQYDLANASIATIELPKSSSRLQNATMSVDLVHPAPKPSPQQALSVSQLAPQIIKNAPSRPLPWPLSLISSQDTEEHWAMYETLYLSCLRTSDDRSAKALLDKLIARFGDQNERVMAYQAMYAEARADNEKEQASLLKDLEALLDADPTNVPIQKRRIALLKTMGKTNEAIQKLVDLLQVSPTDAEAWAELAELYLAQNSYDQAIFCLEEVLLIAPNAWNMHARLGEIIYISTTATASNNSGELARGLAESMRRFCRSIELCNNYLRGYYGLKLTTKRLVEVLPQAPKSKDSAESSYTDLPLPFLDVVQRLEVLATEKLAEIIQKGTRGEKGWEGYDEPELIAARELLDRDAKIQR